MKGEVPNDPAPRARDGSLSLSRWRWQLRLKRRPLDALWVCLLVEWQWLKPVLMRLFLECCKRCNPACARRRRAAAGHRGPPPRRDPQRIRAGSPRRDTKKPRLEPPIGRWRFDTQPWFPPGIVLFVVVVAVEFVVDYYIGSDMGVVDRPRRPLCSFRSWYYCCCRDCRGARWHSWTAPP